METFITDVKANLNNILDDIGIDDFITGVCHMFPSPIFVGTNFQMMQYHKIFLDLKNASLCYYILHNTVLINNTNIIALLNYSIIKENNLFMIILSFTNFLLKFDIVDNIRTLVNMITYGRFEYNDVLNEVLHNWIFINSTNPFFYNRTKLIELFERAQSSKIDTLKKFITLYG